jgi:hypothetical protein
MRARRGAGTMTGLAELDLADNDIGVEGAHALAGVLGRMLGLVKLILVTTASRPKGRGYLRGR